MTQKFTAARSRSLSQLELSVFLHRLPELLARVLLICIAAVIFPGWFIAIIIGGFAEVAIARLYYSLRVHRSDPRVTLQRLPGLVLVYITAAPPRDYQQHVSEFSAFALYHRGSEFFLHRGAEYCLTVGLILLFGRGDSTAAATTQAAGQQAATFEAMRVPLLMFGGLLLAQMLGMAFAYRAQVNFQRVLAESNRIAAAAAAGRSFPGCTSATMATGLASHRRRRTTRRRQCSFSWRLAALGVLWSSARWLTAVGPRPRKHQLAVSR